MDEDKQETKSRRKVVAVILGIVAAVLLVFGIAACGGSNNGSNVPPMNSGMTAWGVQVGGGYDCYYVNNPAEVQYLIAAGHCPPGSIPTLVPTSWLDLHYGYYDSPAYYNAYVPVGMRSYYASYWGAGGTYYKQNKTVIINIQHNPPAPTTLQPTGGRNAPQPSATKTFGNGARATVTFGNGARQTVPPTIKPPATKAPTFGNGQHH